MKSPSILIISTEFPPNVGGIGNHAFNLAKSLSGEGYKISVVADIVDIGEEQWNNFKSTLSFSVEPIFRNSFVPFSYAKRVIRAIQSCAGKEQVILSGKFSLWLATLIRLFHPSINLVAIAHGTELDLKGRFSKSLVNKGLRRCNKIISVSRYTEKFLPSLNFKIKRFVIPNGVDINSFKKVETKQVTGEPILITIGTLSERKGQQNVIAALPII